MYIYIYILIYMYIYVYMHHTWAIPIRALVLFRDFMYSLYIPQHLHAPGNVSRSSSLL